jgi:hypothetical protein
MKGERKPAPKKRCNSTNCTHRYQYSFKTNVNCNRLHVGKCSQHYSI